MNMTNDQAWAHITQILLRIQSGVTQYGPVPTRAAQELGRFIFDTFNATKDTPSGLEALPMFENLEKLVAIGNQSGKQCGCEKYCARGLQIEHGEPRVLHDKSLLARLTDAVHEGAVNAANAALLNGGSVNYHEAIREGLLHAARKGLRPFSDLTPGDRL